MGGALWWDSLRPSTLPSAYKCSPLPLQAWEKRVAPALAEPLESDLAPGQSVTEEWGAAAVGGLPLWEVLSERQRVAPRGAFLCPALTHVAAGTPPGFPISGGGGGEAVFAKEFQPLPLPLPWDGLMPIATPRCSGFPGNLCSVEKQRGWGGLNRGLGENKAADFCSLALPACIRNEGPPCALDPQVWVP